MDDKPTTSSLLHKVAQSRYLNVFVFVLVFGTIGASVLLYSQAAPSKGKKSFVTTNSEAIATISLKPASQKIRSGSNFTFEIWEDSLNKAVNAVQANLSFDTEAFEFVSIDSTGSPFEITAQSRCVGGDITIARGRVGELTGKQLVAKVTLKARKNSGKTSINFTEGTMLSSSSTNTDILRTKTGGSYYFTR